MSFITKRERVFNEYDLYDLPARNEGKLKAYASCTDARAWSHFCSDKSEHLVDIIKRNNDRCRPKYVPTEAIVNTLMANKQTEIARLKRKIEEFEQMLAAYDELELTCDQKCEIAKAHAAIKEANKDLHELYFDLDLSGFTGIDSDDFETGKSRGDELTRYQEDGGETARSKGYEGNYEPQKDTKSIQTSQESESSSNKGTNITDKRIDEMKDALITKDAKLCAMKNTAAILENDVCEPYCIYAHIYTAIEKIFGILCQNEKYKLYLNLMTTGKDIRCIDIKGKIFFKLKVLEKFSLALISQCPPEQSDSTNPKQCACYHAKIENRIETAYALTSSEMQPCSDEKRAHLFADIMKNDEIKEILNNESSSFNTEYFIDNDERETIKIDQENVRRIKKLQENYDDLMNCYEDLKHERACLQIRCQKYEELEKELETLKSQLREYNALWNEKEHYRRRSLDLDSLKEQYMVLCDETTNIESELKAQTEINDGKTKTIDELRIENLELERRLNEAFITLEKEQNTAQCKLKDSECTIMCQEQQIKSLSIQIDRILENDSEETKPCGSPAIALMDEINCLKDQIKNFKDILCCNEEEKQHLLQEYQNKLDMINDLKTELEDLKSNYEKLLERNEYLEKYTISFRDEVQMLVDENRSLSIEVRNKSSAVDNLRDIINNKSQEVNKLIEDVEQRNKQNNALHEEIQSLHETYNNSFTALDTEKSRMMRSIQLAKQESQELLEKVKNYDEIIQHQDELEDLYRDLTEENKRLQTLLLNMEQEKRTLEIDLIKRENNNAILTKEIQRLQEMNAYASSSINSFKEKENQYKYSLELTKKDSKILEEKLQNFEELTHDMQQLKESHEKLIQERSKLEEELAAKTLQLDNAIYANKLTTKKYYELNNKLQHAEILESDYNNIDERYKQLIIEKQNLQSELNEKKQQYDELMEAYNDLKNKLDTLSGTFEDVEELSRKLSYLKETYNNLLAEKNVLKNDCDRKTDEINNLSNALESKIEENRSLYQQVNKLKESQGLFQNTIEALQEEDTTTKSNLYSLRKESDDLMNRLKDFERLESRYNQLNEDHDQVTKEKDRLQKELNKLMMSIKKIEKENADLSTESQMLLLHEEVLEKALINARTEVISGTSTPETLNINILKEIEEMKREKQQSQMKINNLLQKLDEYECAFSKLNNDILLRDNIIAERENHINELQDEVEKLHAIIEEMLNTSEQIRDNSSKRISETLKSMEAHHSKATHNMKMELAKLQNDNFRLEERLSISKIKSDDSIREKSNFLYQINDFKTEREIIVTDIKQLELDSTGDSALSPTNSDVENVLFSLDRIKRQFDAINLKSLSLEKTIRAVQNKADEAKKIVENEKQKVLNEKEDAIKERVNLEQQLANVKQQLEKQVSLDKKVIHDLEAEIQNQKLIFKKLNESTQTYIAKLKEEIESLQELYQKSLENISDMEKRLKEVSEDKNSYLNIIENVNVKLEEQSNEIQALHIELERLKINQSFSPEALSVEKKNKDVQTDEFQYDDFNKYGIDNKVKSADVVRFNTTNVLQPDDHDRKDVQEENRMHVNEVQVLTANVEPTFDFVKSNYLNHKLKLLSTGGVEHFSITNDANKDIEESGPNINRGSYHIAEDTNVINIFNKQSIHSNSSKVNDEYQENKKESTEKESSIADFGLILKSLDTNSSAKASDLFGSVSGVSTNKDLFYIYKDSDTNHAKSYNKISLPTNDHNIIIHPDKEENSPFNNKKLTKIQNLRAIEKNSSANTENDELATEDDSVKHKLEIDMPRIENESPTTYTLSDDEFNSRSASKMTYSSSGKSSKNLIPSSDKINTEGKSLGSSTYVKNRKNEESHHKLSRIDADERLMKYKAVDKTYEEDKKKSRDLGLDFILATVEGDQDPDGMNTYKAAHSMKKTSSTDLFKIIKLSGQNDSSHSRNDLMESSQDHKETFSAALYNDSGSRSFSDKSVMVQLDDIAKYEETIKYLTNLLENTKKHYEQKLDVMKFQYDNHIKSIFNDHDEGVKNIQGLHEDTLQDLQKRHENEVEGLRSMSIEAMRKADKLQKEVRSLKCKISICSSTCLDEEPTKIASDRKGKFRVDSRTLTKTEVEAFNVKPESRSNGPCTCSLDINLWDTIRNMFQQLDVEQRKNAENTYLKYIAKKILSGTVEALDFQELSFLHLKVCGIWKVKIKEEETLQKRIESLKAELVNKQRHTQHNMAELDRKVAEERRRLEEAREVVFGNVPMSSRCDYSEIQHLLPAPSEYVDFHCPPGHLTTAVEERQSAGDLGTMLVPNVSLRPKRLRQDSHKSKMTAEERREKRSHQSYNDEPPTRLRRQPDRQNLRSKK